MNVKRYFGKTAHEALQALKAELGADAIVLSNRAVSGGVEIIALPAEDIGSLTQAAPPSETAAPAPAPVKKAAAPARTRRPTIAEQYGMEDGRAPNDEAHYHVELSRAAPRAKAPAPRPAAPAATPAVGQVIRPFQPPHVQPVASAQWEEDQALLEADPYATAAFAAPSGAAAYQNNQIATPWPAAETPAPAVPAPRPVAAAPVAQTQTTPRPAAARPKAAAAPRPKVVAPRPAPVAANPVAPQQPAVAAPAAAAAPTAAPRPKAPAAPTAAQIEAKQNAERIRALQADNERLMAELTGIRSMIERQLTSFAWDETRRRAPSRAQVVGELLQAGFSARLTRELGETIPEGLMLDEARTRVKDVISRRLRVANADADFIDQGGIYALVGPTGVGKTTTTAKIAARAVVRHGANRLALITTDGYRIGAQEQLRIYGRILGVPVFPVRDGGELQRTLAQLRDKHLVLIDTVGMSQRDRMVAHQAAMLAGAGNVRRLLLLNSTARGDTLDDVVAAWKGPDLAGCIFSKTDEAASLAPALSAALSHELNVYYLTNGQRVPEDLHLPNRAYLLNRALHVAGAESPWRLGGEETALLLAANGE